MSKVEIRVLLGETTFDALRELSRGVGFDEYIGDMICARMGEKVAANRLQEIATKHASMLTPPMPTGRARSWSCPFCMPSICTCHNQLLTKR